jgi:hypothetical protein
MKNPQEMAKAEMIAQLVQKNIKGSDANGIPCLTLCLKVCLRCVLQ